MKTQDKKALHAKSQEDLQKLIKEAYNTLSNLKLDNVQNKLQNTRNIFNTRQEIAVMQTIVREKQVKEVTQEAKAEPKVPAKESSEKKKK